MRLGRCPQYCLFCFPASVVLIDAYTVFSLQRLDENVTSIFACLE